MLAMVHALLDYDLAAEMTENDMLLTLFELRATHQRLARHDDLRQELLPREFTRVLQAVGPNGVECSVNVTDGGKTNPNGQYICALLIPSRNPLLGADHAKAVMMLWRWLCGGETFPDLIDYNSYFPIPMLRAPSADQMLRVNYRTSNSNHKKLYDTHQVFCNKVLHQGRGQGQRNLNLIGGADLDEDIKRMCDYVNDDQNMSYLLNLAVHGSAAASGWDYRDLQSIDSPHWIDAEAEEFRDDQGLSLVEQLLPDFAVQRRKVVLARSRAQSKQEVIDSRLATAMGVVNAVRHWCVLFLTTAASRMRDANGDLIKGSDVARVYQRFQTKNLLYQRPVFKSAGFQRLVAKVAAREELELNGTE